MAPLGLGVGAVRVGDHAQVAHHPSQPGRVQPSGGLDQDRFGLGGQVVGQVSGAVSQDAGVSDRDGPISQGGRGLGQRSAE